MKSQAAKFAVPLLAGLLPTAFFVGRAYGSDRGDLVAVSKRVADVEASVAAKVKKADEDHDILVRVDERVAAMKMTMDAFLRKALEALGTREERTTPR